MNRYFSYISAIILLMTSFSCTKEKMPDIDHSLNGVDRDNIVDVNIPLYSGDGMENIVVTKAADMDSQLSSVLIMVYEAVDPNKPALNKFVYSRFYNKASSSNGQETEGWFPNSGDLTKGKMAFKTPTGDVYVYLVANWTNSFIDFAVGVPESNLLDPNNMPKTQLELMQNFVPTWKGNVHRVDGLVPMIATVNNSTGLCHIDRNGVITYKNDAGKEFTLADPQTIQTYTKDNCFNFKRLMSKVTVTLKAGTTVNPNCSFTPKHYTVKNVSKYIAPTENSWKNAGPELESFLSEVGDVTRSHFSTQNPNSFTIYIPESLQPFVSGITSQKDRELMVKTANGENELYGSTDPLSGAFKFANAPKFSTYIEVIGRFEDPKNDIISADTRFFIHLGNFSKSLPADTRYGHFSLERDHHYLYTATINGVNDIIVESKDRIETGNPENPGFDGLVFKGGYRAYCDAHYDQVELLLNKETLQNNGKGIVLFADTPYGHLSSVYYPKGSSIGGSTGKIVSVTGKEIDLNTAKANLKWIELRKQKTKGKFEKYYIENEPLIDIFTAIDECYNAKDNTPAYYTCFVDEYFYTSNPITGEPVTLRDFVNQRDRTFAIGKDMYVSQDGFSICVDAVFLIYQKSICTFYDLNDNSTRKYGVESLNETGRFKGTDGYGYPKIDGSDKWNGWLNTKNEVGLQPCIDWEKNGWMLVEEGGKSVLKDQGRNRLRIAGEKTYQRGYLACLTRNRDFNGNGLIDENELRWYNPAINQALGFWIGQASLPSTGALYPHQLTSSYIGDGSNGQNIIYTSTSGVTRALWAEEGSSFGGLEQSYKYGGEVRCVRNLGFGIPDENDFHDPNERMEEYYYFTYDSKTRLVEMHLAPTSLRTFSQTELEPHTERTVVNQLHRKFQMANTSMGRYGAFGIWIYTSYNVVNAKTDHYTAARTYPGYGETAFEGAGDWRLPNQRELTVMYMLNFGGATLGPAAISEKYVHCRTTYTLNSVLSKKNGLGIYGQNYTNWGFGYNLDNDKIENMGESGGYYLCVRDVR